MLRLRANINNLFIFINYNENILLNTGDIMAKRSVLDNKLKILQLINQNGAISRVDIAKMLGFTKSAITIVTNEMVNEKLIYEKNIVINKSQKNVRGRKKILLDVNENFKLVLGIVLEKDRLTVGITNLFGQTVDVNSVQISKTMVSDISAIAYEMVSEILSVNWVEKENILGIGAAITSDAIEHFNENAVQNCCQIFKKALSRYFEYEITVNHFTYSVAISQKVYKALTSKDIEDYIIIRKSHMIESKIVIDGKIGDSLGENLSWFENLENFVGEDDGRRLQRAINMIKIILNPNKIFIFTDINNETLDNLKNDKTVKVFSKNFEEKYYSNLKVVNDSIKTTVHVFATALAVSDYFYRY